MDIGRSPVPRSNGLSKRYVPLVSRTNVWTSSAGSFTENLHKESRHNPVCTVTTIIQKCLWFTQVATSGAEKWFQHRMLKTAVPLMSTRCSSSESTHPPTVFIHFLLLIQSVEVLEPITGFKVQQRSGVHCLLHSRDASGACRELCCQLTAV